MLDSNYFRLWAVVDSESRSIVFASYSYSLSQSFRDRLWKSFYDSALDIGDKDALFCQDWKKRFQLVRYDISRSYIPVTPLKAAGAAFVESLRGS